MLCHVFPPVCLFRLMFVVFLWSGHVRSVIVRRLRPLLLPGFFVSHLFPIISLIVCLIRFSCVLLIPLVCFTCVLSLFPLLYIVLSFCIPLSDCNSLSVRIYAWILHFFPSTWYRIRFSDFWSSVFLPLEFCLPVISLDFLVFALLCFFPFGILFLPYCEKA